MGDFDINYFYKIYVSNLKNNSVAKKNIITSNKKIIGLFFKKYKYILNEKTFIGESSLGEINVDYMNYIEIANLLNINKEELKTQILNNGGRLNKHGEIIFKDICSINQFDEYISSILVIIELCN